MSAGKSTQRGYRGKPRRGKVYNFTRAGECKVTRVDGSSVTLPAYDKDQLRRVIQVRSSNSPGTRRTVWTRDDNKCRYCGLTLPVEDYHIVHIVPVALGGSNRMSNLVTACAMCKDEKSDTVWKPKPLSKRR